MQKYTSSNKLIKVAKELPAFACVVSMNNFASFYVCYGFLIVVAFQSITAYMRRDDDHGNPESCLKISLFTVMFEYMRKIAIE